MRVMLFIDSDNFFGSLKQVDKKRKDRISKFSDFIIGYLNKKSYSKLDVLDRVRTYLYTGEFTDSLIKRINKEYGDSNNVDLKGVLDYAEKQREFQQKFFNIAINFNSFEIRAKPLQFGNDKIFQKGVDVQIAVDMITHAYNNSYDVVILCSGDADLIESLKVLKNLGKKVIVCSHTKSCSKNIRKEADIFIDMADFTDDELNEFSFIKK